MSKVAPCLWFNGVAEAAASFYVSLLPGSQIDAILRNPVDTPSGPTGSVLVVEFTLAGQSFMALNGGPQFLFSPAVSFKIDCDDQTEVDRLWAVLCAEGGQPGQCGWLTDHFGVSWQIVPKGLLPLLADPARAPRVMTALMAMGKLDLAALQAA